jgi:hypothetical protein
MRALMYPLFCCLHLQYFACLLARDGQALDNVRAPENAGIPRIYIVMSVHDGMQKHNQEVLYHSPTPPDQSQPHAVRPL